MIRSRPIAILAVVLQLSTTACYSYTTVQTAPPPGTQVALEVTDEGRVALRDKIGPGVVRLEGTMAGVDSSGLLVDAQAVRQVKGYISDLGGVRVTLPRQYVTRIDERRFNTSRTLIVAGAIVGVVAAFILAKGFGGRGTPPEGTGGGGPDQ